MPLVVDDKKPTITIEVDDKQEEIQNVYIEYSIPEEIKNLITLEFLTEFRKQLYRMHEYYSLDLFADDGIPMNPSTSGWYAAFGKACLISGKEDLLKYWYSLPWYDSDIFDSELTEMLVSNNLILDDIENLAKKYGITTSDTDIVYCNKCYEFYHSKDTDIMDKNDEDYIDDEEYIPHICHKCNGKNKNITTIKEELLNKVGSMPNLLAQELNIKNICTCSICNHLYINNMGSFIDSKFVCDFCNDYLQNTEYKTTNYYRETLDELKKWKKENITEDN